MIDVLLVEDNPGDVVMLTEAIQEAHLDYRLHQACDGLAALDLLEGDPSLVRQLDLVILDLNLPRMDGFRLLDKMKARMDLAALKVAVLTSSSWNDTPRTLRNFSRDAFFQKPCLLKEWVEVVNAIDAYRRRETPARAEVP